LVTQPPESADWLSEIKFDGYRLIASISQGRVRLLTRNGLDWANRLPHVAAAFVRLNVMTAMLDGELVALGPDGASSFPELQAFLSDGADHRLHFYMFDLLHLNGWDLRPCALIDRKRVLSGLADWRGLLRYSEHVEGSAGALYQRACAMDLEGIVCKAIAAPYRAGRGGNWLKLKCGRREEFVVVGWTLPAGSRIGLGALHLGYFDPEGQLHYAGAVGTGFDDRELARLRGILDTMPATGSPAGMLYAGDPLDPAIRWVQPKLIAEVRFATWSGYGRVRHPVYLGLREDKEPCDMVRPVADPAVKRQEVRRRPSGAAIVQASAPRPRRRNHAVPPLSR
jgi:bifunctional non-homologous end joining protein LigD